MAALPLYRVFPSYYPKSALKGTIRCSSVAITRQVEAPAYHFRTPSTSRTSCLTMAMAVAPAAMTRINVNTMASRPGRAS